MQHSINNKKTTFYLLIILLLFYFVSGGARNLHLSAVAQGDPMHITTNKIIEKDPANTSTRQYRVVFEAPRKGVYHFKVIADDCLVAVYYENAALPFTKPNSCQFPQSKAITIPVPHAGQQTFFMTVRNVGGPIGVEIQPKHFKVTFGYTALLVILVLVIRELTGWGRDWSLLTQGMFIVSLVFAALQGLTTTYFEHANDISGHLGYITHLVQHHSLPDPYGWQTQQPPLYYTIAALFYGLGQWLPVTDPFYVVRYFSFICYAAFLFFNLRFLKLYLDKHWFVLASALVLFWPEGFNLANKISNDIPLMLLMTMTLYYISRWHITWEARDLRIAQYCAVVALMVKGTGIIPIAAVLLCMAWAKWKKPELAWRSFGNGRLLIFSVIGVGLNFGRSLYYRVFHDADVKWFMQWNVKDIEKYFLDSHFYNYLYFDYTSFIQKPFEWAGPYFWNIFLKTLLFGEWTWQSAKAGYVINFMLVAIMLLIISYLFLKPRLKNEEVVFSAVIFVICMIGALMGAHIIGPWPQQANGRYIYSIIVIIALLVIRALQWHRQEGRNLLFYSGVLVIIGFCTASILLITTEFATALGIL